jgi:cyclopropane fatty-acyl-phospholipid synthase-like methyltransferase
MTSAMRRRLLAGLAPVLAVLSCTAEHQHAHRRFDDAEAWAKSFEDPARDAWQKPEQVIAELKLAPGAKVADIGAATGYFPVRFAKVVPQGHVYGVDIESSMVEYLTKRAAAEGIPNLTAVLGAVDDAKIPEPVDLILMVNTYHHIEARPAYFAKLAASLKPGGRVAIIDFRKGSSKGPPDSEKAPVGMVLKELGEAGFQPVGAFDFLPEQFFLVFAREPGT